MVEGGGPAWGCWGRHRASSDVREAGACSRTRSPCGATPSPAVTLGGLRVQDAGAERRLQRLMRSGRLSLCTTLGGLLLAAGRWRGYPEGPGGTRRPRTPAATALMGPGADSQPGPGRAGPQDAWQVRRCAGPEGDAVVVCREAPWPLWTHPSTVFPQSQAPPLGKVCDEQSETGCSPSRWAGAPGSEQLVGGPSEKCRPCSAPRRPH